VDVSTLEPAERDPKKLRRTAYFLVLIMIVGGLGLHYAYHKYQVKESQSGRPSVEHRLKKNLQFVTASGEVSDFSSLEGDVWIALGVTQKIQPESQPSIDAIKKLKASFASDDKKPRIVLFVLDIDDENPSEMNSVLPELGQEPDVTRIAAGAETKTPIREYLKNQMRFGLLPLEKDGRIIYDTKLVIVEQHLRLCGLPGSNEGWDFQAVAQMEEKYEKARIENPGKELNPLPMTTNRLQELLEQSVRYVIENPIPEK